MNTAEDFARFVASQQETDADPNIDWAGVRDQWLDDLDTLHRKVDALLQEYVPGKISYDFTEIELNEPDIGKYLAKRMDIKIGRQQVSLVPVGTLLIGCRGRVDAVGSAGRASILLVDEKVKGAADLINVTVSTTGSAPAVLSGQTPPGPWVWKILTNAVQRRFVDLDRESFFALLMEIASA